MKRDPILIYILEAALTLTFFVQALRFATGIYYSRVSGAAVVSLIDPALLPRDIPGLLDPAAVGSEVTLLILALLLPLLALLFGRSPTLLIAALGLTAVGRALLNLGGVSPAVAAALTVGGGLLYIALLVRHRARALPLGMILALGADQVLRAVGDTLDPSWSPDYLNVQIALSAAAILLGLLAFTRQRRFEAVLREQEVVSPDRGALALWGGIGLGGLLFLQLALLTLPNAIAGRAQTEYATFVPLTLAATLLPIVPWVRAQARAFVALFDLNTRGWVWMLLIILLIVLGTRLSGLIAGLALVLAQFLASLLWWYLARPLPARGLNLTGLWVVLGVVAFGLLAAGDFFTYEYAFVRDFGGNLSFLDPIIPPLLRGFRGLGLGVLLLAAFFAALPMTQTLRRLPWQGGARMATIAALLIVIAATAGAAFFARPRVIAGVQNAETIRVATYNIHAGTNEFFHPDLEAIASTIRVSGADVVLLQEVEIGRLTSFGVDQALWLARRVGMDRRFYATNEGLQGLAVLSRMPITQDEGILLTSVYQQTGAQRVQIEPAPDAPVTLYNTWLGVLTASESGVLEAQTQDQAQQFAELLAWVASHNPGGILGRTVIGGTFHNVPDSPLAEQMRVAGFDDPFAGLPLELSATLWRTGVPRVRFDYLWLRRLGRLSAGVIDTSASDHRMAVAEVSLER
jgi:endonuclease/exonuclease/phosphatase family metal-dependent hydrolase